MIEPGTPPLSLRVLSPICSLREKRHARVIPTGLVPLELIVPLMARPTAGHARTDTRSPMLTRAVRETPASVWRASEHCLGGIPPVIVTGIRRGSSDAHPPTFADANQSDAGDTCIGVTRRLCGAMKLRRAPAKLRERTHARVQLERVLVQPELIAPLTARPTAGRARPATRGCGHEGGSVSGVHAAE